MQGTCLTAVVLLWEIFSLNHQSLCLPREHSSGIVLPAQRCISPSGVAYQHLKGTLCFSGASHVLSLLAIGRARCAVASEMLHHPSSNTIFTHKEERNLLRGHAPHI